MTTTTTRPPAYDDLLPLMALMTGDEKHTDAATSTLDVLWVLYRHVLRRDAADVSARDRFLLSKGHGPMAYYATLAAFGLLDRSMLSGFASFDSPLGNHPDRVLVPAVEVSSGSLGHGLPIAVGLALAQRAAERGARTFVLLGDGELDEGSNHEAMAFAGRTSLSSLTAIVVDNASSTWGWPGGIERRFMVEGWAARTVDGHDHDALRSALTDNDPTRPSAVVATVRPKPTRDGKQVRR